MGHGFVVPRQSQPVEVEVSVSIEHSPGPVIRGVFEEHRERLVGGGAFLGWEDQVIGKPSSIWTGSNNPKSGACRRRGARE